ncbi:MAG: NAD-dependent protein deacylase [Methanobrevibacter sp.]|jgi:NAD-dependent deacetylase|nr:NAD-dependent protein deacylase [Methanobrevibacter sp.]
MSKIDQLREIIANSNNIVFFGGAGVSTESGIPDFRSEEGIYKTFKDFRDCPETILSHSYFILFPDEFYKYYKDNLIYKDAKPNPAHFALAKLEKEGKLNGIITQNVDGLHQKAGSKNLVELHGSVYRNYCMECKKFYDLNYILESNGVPTCVCGGLIKPDVTLYEEALNQNSLNLVIDLISNAEVLIVGGTSLVVQPAANLIHYFQGKKLVFINKNRTSYDENADLVIHDKIGEVLSSIFI